MLLLTESQIQCITRLLFEASLLLLDYDRNNLSVYKKTDGTKVTDADLEVNDYIVTRLKQVCPNIPIISEECDIDKLDSKLIVSSKPFFCLDPIDGTNAFIQGVDEYVINLGVVEKGVCNYGWIATPSTKQVYYCMQNKIFKYLNGKNVLVTRKQSEDAYIMPKANRVQVTTFNNEKFIFQSSALKFVSFIEGKGRYLIQTHNTKLWDVAAGFAFLKCFGLEAISSDNHKLVKLNSLNVPPFYVNNV